MTNIAEPTPEMIEAGEAAYDREPAGDGAHRRGLAKAYTAMRSSAPQEPVADDVLQAMDAAIDQVFDHAEQTFAVLVEGLHAQIFGIYSLGDPALSHAALADGGQIHEAVHALIRALPANRLQAKAPETAK